MRILVSHPGPSFSVHDVHVGWCEALRELGQEVIEYPFSDTLTFYGSVLMEAGEGTFKRALTSEQATGLAVDRLCAALYKARPDVLVSVSAFFLPTQLFDAARRYGTRVVILHTESPYEDQRQTELAAHADVNLVNDPTNLAKFQELGSAWYVPHSYRPSLHKPGLRDPALACDFAFIGTGFPSRVSFFEAMDFEGLDVILGGNWQHLSEDSLLHKYVAHEVEECLDNDDAVSIYQSAKVGMNLYRREAESPEQVAGWAMGPREVEMSACQTFFLRDPRPESDQVLGMLPTFDGPEDASEKLRWWLKHDSERKELATQARAAIADRTFKVQAARLLRHLES